MTLSTILTISSIISGLLFISAYNLFKFKII